jgi:hypothetical protein
VLISCAYPYHGKKYRTVPIDTARQTAYHGNDTKSEKIHARRETDEEKYSYAHPGREILYFSRSDCDNDHADRVLTSLIL